MFQLRNRSCRGIFYGLICACALILPCGASTGMQVQPNANRSALSSIGVVTFPDGTIGVAIGMADRLPAGWSLIGADSLEPTLVLPNSERDPRLKITQFRGTGALQNVSISQVGSNLHVTLHLSAIEQIKTQPSLNRVILRVLPAPSGANPGSPNGASSASSGLSAEDLGKTYEVIPLKYADVSEIAGILVGGQQLAPNDVFQPQGSIFSLPTSGNQLGGSPVSVSSTLQQAPASFGDKLDEHVAIDRRLNAVILSGSPDEVAALKAIVDRVDVPLPSVMLECAVVELSETAAHDLGLDLTVNGSGSPIAAGALDAATGQVPQLRGNLQATLFASISHGGGRILATPRVLAMNGTPAQILTGDALPIISTTTFPGPPVLTQQTVTYIAVGVNLQIQPRITNDGYVTSHIFAEVSSVTAFIPTQQGHVPQISLRQASTSATVADGTPFVVGGLLKDEEIQNLSRIPFISSLPILGPLFRVRHDATTKSSLYIIITPHIIQPSARGVAPPSGLPTPDVSRPHGYSDPHQAEGSLVVRAEYPAKSRQGTFERAAIEHFGEGVSKKQTVSGRLTSIHNGVSGMMPKRGGESVKRARTNVLMITGGVLYTALFGYDVFRSHSPIAAGGVLVGAFLTTFFVRRIILERRDAEAATE